MGDKHPVGFGVEGVNPGNQPRLVGVAADGLEGSDFSRHIDGFAKELDPFFAVIEHAAKRAHRLVAHEKHRGLPAPQVVLQVVADTPGFRHARG